jgi:sec-independent protein translocase protein TatA
MFGSLGVPELLIIFAIIMLLFGARKLPDIGRGLGRGINNFKQALKGGKGEIESGEEEEEEREEKKQPAETKH